MTPNPRRALVLVLGAFVVLALGFSVTVPLGESSDEVSHWSYVQYLVNRRELPMPEGAVMGESHQPPLYYLLGALATFWVPAQDFQVVANPDFVLGDPQTPNVLLHTRREGFPYQGAALAWHLVRLLSIIMGAVTVWATWQSARLLLTHAHAPDARSEWIALAATAFVAFLPEFLFISAVVNNDNLIIMLSALAMLQSIRFLQGHRRLHDTALLGILLGLALMTKLSGLVLWIFVMSVLLWTAWRHGTWLEFAKHAALVFGIAAVIVLPWAVSNQLRYGDPVGWSLLAAVSPNRVSPMNWNDWTWFLGGLYTSFWGRFGGVVQLRMADAVYVGLGLVLLLGCAGWVGYVRDARRGRLSGGVRRVFGLFILFWGILLAAHLRWTLAILGTDQARQLFPGLPVLALVLALGIARLFGSRGKLALTAWGAASGLLAIGALIYLQAVFAPPAAWARLPQPTLHLAADFGQVIRVLDADVDRTRLTPGQTLTVQLTWQGLQEMSEDYWLLLQVVGKNGTVANKDGTPSAGRFTTDWWHPGQLAESRHQVIIPEDAPAGTYALRLGLHPFGRWEWLPVRGRDWLDLGSVEIVGTGQ